METLWKGGFSVKLIKSATNMCRNVENHFRFVRERSLRHLGIKYVISLVVISFFFFFWSMQKKKLTCHLIFVDCIQIQNIKNLPLRQHKILSLYARHSLIFPPATNMTRSTLCTAPRSYLQYKVKGSNLQFHHGRILSVLVHLWSINWFIDHGSS